MTRLTKLSVEEMPEEQRRMYEELIANQRGSVRGPFGVWLRSPELVDHMRNFFEFLQQRTSLPPRLRELAILLTVRFWEARYAWNAHEPQALHAGLGPEVISAIGRGERPAFLQPDEAVVFDLCTELQDQHEVSNATYRAAVELLGESGAVESIALIGFYTTVSMTVKAFRIPVPA